MALGDFVRKQFVDIIEWIEPGEGILAYRFPMQDREIQNGARLTVRESQAAVFVNEGRVADVFQPGSYRLTTRTLPLLTNVKNWDRFFESPFKSDVYFFSTRLQMNQRWGTAHTGDAARLGIRGHPASCIWHLFVRDRRPGCGLPQAERTRDDLDR